MSSISLNCDRRDFLAAIGGGIAMSLVPSVSAFGADHVVDRDARGDSARTYKAVKWGMIESGSSIREKFEICRELGYDGMELETPSKHNLKEVLEASIATGLPVHGAVGQKHWDVRLSSPDEAVRNQARQDLLTGLTETKAYGGDSLLLVPGKVTGPDETHDDVWNRSIEQIRQVLPTASKLGVRVLIETVWNGFCETPEQFRDYLDEINSPWVGAYFDIGNVQKFSPSEKWIQVLGNRVVKLDVKDWGAQNGFCKIGDGDVNWPAVCDALAETGFTGWCTAEVPGGDRDLLADIAARMDRVLQR